ncbi:hypothetical protein [Falsibacillus albus]|uniref:hypothetical protein n=1 Tax=Falsibacillus albus TaxID=2478915 RepID=UPI0013149193|nr:hypothetical protein [Falsibacillus albus]
MDIGCYMMMAANVNEIKARQKFIDEQGWKYQSSRSETAKRYDFIFRKKRRKSLA